MRLAAVIVGGALVASLLAPAGAGALPMLTEADAAELAQTLADADAEQSICYGWQVSIDDATGEFSGTDQGSSRGGPGVPVDTALCGRYAVLVAELRYTSESSEAEDQARVEIVSNLDPPLDASELEELGFGADALLAENDDENLTNMAGALPLLAAEHGAAGFVPFEVRTTPLPAGEMPTDQPGSDWWRNYWGTVIVLAVLAVVLAVAAVWGVITLRAHRRRRRRPGAPCARPQPPKEPA